MVKALEVRSDLDGITYSEADNHLIAAVSNIPEYQLSQTISCIQKIGGNSGGNSDGGGSRKGDRSSSSIYNSQVNIHTVYYQNWKGLNEEYCKTVISTRKQKGIRYSQTAIKKEVADTKRHLSEISSSLTNMTSCIAEFSGKTQGTDYSGANDGQEYLVLGGTVNSFGRRTSKRTKTWLTSPSIFTDVY